MSDKIKHYGLGFTDLLLIVFIVLKLTNVINWSWWWVLSPLWIPYALVLLVVLLLFTLNCIINS